MNCPSPEQIDSILDDSDPAELEEFESHVDDCASCQQLLLNRSNDSPWRSITLAADSQERLKQGDTDAGPFETWWGSGIPKVPTVQPTPRVPGYDVYEEIGRGGMAIVYRGQHRKLNRPVAIKVIAHNGTIRAGAWLRFHNEAQAIARLQHPNIIQVFDSGEPNGVPFVSQELADGGTLDEKIARTPQPVRESAELLKTLADAVEYAHQQGIVHRDLKPSNVLFCSGIPKLADFGLAKIMDNDGGVTQTSDVMGSPRYMSPEQAAGHQSEIGPAADVYALGIILYELLTGTTPFNAATPVATMRQVIEEEPVSVRQLNTEVPVDLATICHKCLMKEPTRRYGSAKGLSADLQRFLERKPILARPISWPERAWKWASRNPSSAALVVVTTLGLATLLILWAVMTHKLTVQTTLAKKNAKEAEESLIAEQDANAAADEVLRFISEDVFGAAIPEGKGRELTVADSMLMAVENLSGKFDDRPLVEATLRSTIGNSLSSLGLYQESAEQLRLAVDLFEQLGSRSELHFQAKLAYAITLKEMDRIDESVVQLSELEDADWQVDDRHRLQVRFSQADILLMQRQLEIAVPRLKQLLADSEEQLGKEDTITMNTAGQLAVAVFLSGDLEEARKCFQRNYDESRRILGADHVDAFADANNLAIVVQRLGDYDAAEKIHRDVLERKTRVLGPDHPTTLSTQYNLASVAIRRGDFEGALGLLQPLLQKRIAANGPVATNTLHTIHTTANVLIEMNRPEEAAEFMIQYFDPYLTETRNEAIWGLTYLTYGRIRLHLKDAEAAGELLQAARQIFETQPPRLSPANWQGLEKAEAELESLRNS